MSARIEKLLKEYPRLKRERACLAHQIAHFRGITAEEVIESMYTPRLDSERVKTSGTSDKTAQIALNYPARRERINREWFEHLENNLRVLDEELQFLEAALGTLSGSFPEFMQDMVIERMTWDALEYKYHISRFTVSTYRKKAIAELEVLYAAHEKEVVAYMLL